MSGPIRRSVLSDDVYEQLKSLILEHRLAPKDRVNIDGLARELAVSPTPVREALARLEAEGLLRKRPLAGYTVSPLLTRDEFTDMFDMRLVLETAAARWAAARADAAARAALRAEATVSYEVSAPRSHAACTAADARFHDLVAEAAGNPLLRDAISRLHAHLHIHRLYFPYAETGSTRHEHEAIADAVATGDPDTAESAMRAHLTAARARHLAAFDT
ncbi:DNA-binding GntR family transcriptional regulator [Actinoplanes octamycinicus]|uniref:DNA-binding GntR family transcriptional regulator n=1 Tax=Actinoplanes octamycinicus TaxID=135948 RepID=A0A7W7MA91_9ACTN|nr:GntR family transcriptional regulator [Actinoplanes octamycinicus]MBB4742681.1 DNA-binding GntR family transcriptional regulator [Actinoplanes octamycinicus]GIE62984.1 transcriptional regulator [Actinoplanes octamycinicus]